jgi:hypothetical protein
MKPGLGDDYVGLLSPDQKDDLLRHHEKAI